MNRREAIMSLGALAGIAASCNLLPKDSSVAIAVATESKEKMSDLQAQVLVAYRQSVDAERIGFSLAGVEPPSLPFYKEMFGNAVEKVKAGGDPFSEDFWNDTVPNPTATPNIPAGSPTGVLFKFKGIV